jgi:outer membrane protein assembly factor BamB
VPNSWASPILIETPSGTQLIACGNPWVIAYDPASGREIWQANCLGGDVAPSPVYGSGVVYAVNAGAALAAIRVDGTGDVTATHVLWTAQDDLPDICSPLYAEGLVFLLTTPGLLTCYDGANGQKLWERDLGMSFKASPSLVGRDIYLLSEEGTRLVVEAGRTFAEKRRTTLGEPCRASPAFLDGRILIRAQPHLWCIGSAPAP